MSVVPIPDEGPATDGWLLDEDRALRDWMRGMFASDQEKKARVVGAWFAHPDQEVRAQDYPYVTIELLNIEEATERVHRGNLWMDRTNLPPKWWGLGPLPHTATGWLTEMPTPINLNYQITTWARNPMHDRQMIQQLILGGRTMIRGGWLETADGRIRRLDWHGFQKADIVEGGKRLLSNKVRVMVSSEIPYSPISLVPYALVESVHFRYTPSSSPSNPYDPEPNPEDVTDVLYPPED